MSYKEWTQKQQGGGDSKDNKKEEKDEEKNPDLLKNFKKEDLSFVFSNISDEVFNKYKKSLFNLNKDLKTREAVSKLPDGVNIKIDDSGNISVNKSPGYNLHGAPFGYAASLGAAHGAIRSKYNGKNLSEFENIKDSTYKNNSKDKDIIDKLKSGKGITLGGKILKLGNYYNGQGISISGFGFVDFNDKDNLEEDLSQFVSDCKKHNAILAGRNQNERVKNRKQQAYNKKNNKVYNYISKNIEFKSFKDILGSKHLNEKIILGKDINQDVFNSSRSDLNNCTFAFLKNGITLQKLKDGRISVYEPNESPFSNSYLIIEPNKDVPWYDFGKLDNFYNQIEEKNIKQDKNKILTSVDIPLKVAEKKFPNIGTYTVGDNEKILDKGNLVNILKLDSKSNEELNSLISDCKQRLNYRKSEESIDFFKGKEYNSFLNSFPKNREGKIAKLFTLMEMQHSNYKKQTYINIAKETQDFVKYIDKNKKDTKV